VTTVIPSSLGPCLRAWPRCGARRLCHRGLERGGAGREFTCPLLELREVGADARHRRQRLGGVRQGGAERAQRFEQGPVGCPLVPAQLEEAAHLAQRAGAGQAQLARGGVDRGVQLGPALQAARLRQRDRQQVAPEVDHLPGAEDRAEELHAGLDELVRFVEHRRVHRRQQFGDAAVAQRHVGEEQVMVDDDEVGRHRLAPRLHDVALAVLRAFGAQAVLA